MPTAEITTTIETAIRDRHVLSIDYDAEAGGRGTILAEPLAIRTSTAGHRVLWIWNRDEEHLAELLWDRILDARDTEEVFEPREWEAG